MTDPIMQKLNEIQARCDAATPGPWEICDDGWDIGVCTAGDGTPGIAYVAEKLRQGRDEGESDARFVANARTDMPRLLDAVERVLRRSRMEQMDAEHAMTYAAEINDGLALAVSQSRKQAWCDVDRLISIALTEVSDDA